MRAFEQDQWANFLLCARFRLKNISRDAICLSLIKGLSLSLGLNSEDLAKLETALKLHEHGMIKPLPYNNGRRDLFLLRVLFLCWNAAQIWSSLIGSFQGADRRYPI
jgi:hypothetical protein